TWKSPTTGITYPSSWALTAGGQTLTLTPTVKDQELDPVNSTGFPYWEGAVTVAGSRTGQGYVELVGYH
ncbi:MAG TPA: lipocalin family protein, partial [Chloroflexota bacterium]|nr:lipocalin family protein [Chloroflexota bacterium]